MKVFLLLFAVWAEMVEISAQNPRVTVAEGLLIGRTVTFSEDTYINVTKDVDTFLGVPYANPPVRFAAPESKTPWQGDLTVDQFKPACYQDSSLFYPTVDEDCLYLNVFAPNPKPSGAAVMLWIHGGGFRDGSAMNYGYYGAPLVAVGDVIFVAINYRLGIFGQFTTSDDVAPGNVGMLDQVAALRWVYENIEAFGGDKDRITIFGESAGSASVNFHLLSKLSRPYFSQAIMQSGSALAFWAFQDNPELEREVAVNLGSALGCDTSNSIALVSCLRSKDAGLLQTTANSMNLVYNVINDGSFLADSPSNLYRRDDVKHVPIMAGTNADEGTLTLLFLRFPQYFGSPTPPPIDKQTLEDVVNDLLIQQGVVDDVITDAVLQEYTDWTIADDPTADFFRSVVDAIGDTLFTCPQDTVSRAHTKAGDAVFTYFMTHAPSRSVFSYGTVNTPWLGAGHGEDIVFVFGHPFISELDLVRGELTAEENALSVQFMTFWTNFAKSGDPSRPSLDAPAGEGIYSWPAYTIPELRYKELSPELREGRSLRARQCRFLNEYLPSLIELAGSIDDAEREWKTSFNDWQNENSDWLSEFNKYKAQSTCK